MTKQIFFILAVLCTLQAQASIQPVQVDTVQHTPYYNVSEERQPIQPVYLDGVVLPASRTGNWFVSIAGGTSAFLGTPLGCEDLFGRLKPSYSFAVGKWFTPSVGARINYSGVQFKENKSSMLKSRCTSAYSSMDVVVLLLILYPVFACKYSKFSALFLNSAENLYLFKTIYM